MNSKSSISIKDSLQENTIKDNYHFLSDEQQHAVKDLCDDHNLMCSLGELGPEKQPP